MTRNGRGAGRGVARDLAAGIAAVRPAPGGAALSGQESAELAQRGRAGAPRRAAQALSAATTTGCASPQSEIEIPMGKRAPGCSDTQPDAAAPGRARSTGISAMPKIIA